MHAHLLAHTIELRDVGAVRGLVQRLAWKMSATCPRRTTSPSTCRGIRRSAGQRCRGQLVGLIAQCVGARCQTWPMGSDGFEGWTDEDDVRLEFEALPSWHPALFVDVFRVALAVEPNEGNALLRLGFVTPESVPWWGDFSGARMLLGAGLKISMSALYAADAPDVAYVRLVETDRHRSSGTVRLAATAHATLVWRPELAAVPDTSWRIHRLGQPVDPMVVPRSTPGFDPRTLR